MKKLLIVAEFNSLNGGENSMLAVLPLLIEAGWRIKIAFPAGAAAIGKTGCPEQSVNQSAQKLDQNSDDKTLADEIAKWDVRGVALATHLPCGTRKTQTQYRADVAKLLNDHFPDLVWCNSLSTSRLVGPVTDSLNIPAVGCLRDIIKLSKTAIADINQLDRIVAVSQATQDFHVAQGIQEKKLSVIHNGVDLDLFRPHVGDWSIKAELGIPAGSPALLFVGQIGLRKGVDVLLDVFENVLGQVPACRLLIVGQRHSVKQESVDYEANLLQRSQSGVLAGKVHWLNRRDDLPEIYAGVDLLIHPARQEPLGRVILESIASGLPVVTTSVGGSPEIVGDCRALDLLCPVDDVSSIAQRVIKIIGDPGLRSDLSNELRQIAEQRFGRHACFFKYENLLHQLLAPVPWHR